MIHWKENESSKPQLEASWQLLVLKPLDNDWLRKHISKINASYMHIAVALTVSAYTIVTLRLGNSEDQKSFPDFPFAETRAAIILYSASSSNSGYT